MHKRYKIAGAICAVAIVLSGCSSMSTAPDQVGLHYKGGPFSATKFANCIDPSTKNWDGPSDPHYAYPAGQRTFSFTGAENSEKAPIAVTTSDGQQITVPGVVTFHLDTTCDVLRQFHEQIGLKYAAYMDGDSTSDGWANMLNDYVYIPLEAIMNNSAQNFGWQDLYNNKSAVTQLSADVVRSLQTRIDTAMGGNYLEIQSVTLGRPVISPELQQGNTDIQKAHLEQQAQLQQNKVYHDKYDTFADCQKVLTQENCILFYAIEKNKVNIFPVPNGQPLTLPVH